MKTNINILAIESSCDETSMSVVRNGRDVLSLVISSQIDIHKLYGGVVPEIASRNHVLALNSVFEETLCRAKLTMDDIDAIAVTYGAGLMGALIVGVNFAKGLAYSYNKPLIKVNHIEGHIAANYISHKELEPPFACLIVSGGHTALVKMEDYTTRVLYGTTHDDAVGECFDKVARELGLEYPGGPKIDKLAKEGKKTAVINYVHKLTQNGEELNKEDICASFQAEAVDGLVMRVVKAAKEYNMDKICIAGGVAANSYLREKIEKEGGKAGVTVYAPSIRLCTDNAAMIACLGYYNLINGEGISDMALSAQPSLKI